MRHDIIEYAEISPVIGRTVTVTVDRPLGSYHPEHKDMYYLIGKKPVLAIEVDGYEYHKEDTVQASRDLLKNHIMELYEVPLLRFMTNGSGEKEKIIEMLDKLVG